MKRRTIKERSSNDDMLIKQALEATIKAKQLLDDAANTIRDARGETFLFARLDSHSMDLGDTIDDIKGILAERSDDTDDEYISESRDAGTPSINGNAKRFLLQRTRRRLDEIGQRL